MVRHEAWTQSYNGLVNRIIIIVAITNDKGETKDYKGIVDTGATHTCVSAELAAEMKLVSIGLTESKTAQGKHEVPMYIVDLALCEGRVRSLGHKVIMANLTEIEGVDMLVGMDILVAGDFAITNKDGKTIASFHVPSIKSIDFVKEADNFNRFEVERAKREANRAKKRG